MTTLIERIEARLRAEATPENKRKKNGEWPERVRALMTEAADHIEALEKRLSVGYAAEFNALRAQLATAEREREEWKGKCIALQVALDVALEETR